MPPQKILGLLQQEGAILDLAELMVGAGNDDEAVRYVGARQRLVHDFRLLEGDLRVHCSLQHQQRNLEVRGMQMR